MKRQWIAYALAGLVLTAGMGCSSSDKGTGGEETVTQVSLKFGDLMNEQRMYIDENGYLELWAVTGGEYISLGQFTVDFNGNAVDQTQAVIEAFEIEGELPNGSRLVVTFEVSGGLASADQRGPEIMSADVDGDTLDLAFSQMYTGIQGQFLVVTPSDGGGTPDVQDEDATHPYCGIWFSARDWGKPGVGLGLAVPPDGWEYEGWLMHREMEFVSMGRFDSVNVADRQNIHLSDLDPTNVSENYHFPGEDFLTNAPDGVSFPFDVRGSMTFVTLEPEDDFDPSYPFLPMTLFCKLIPLGEASTIMSRQLDTPPLPHATAILK